MDGVGAQVPLLDAVGRSADKQLTPGHVLPCACVCVGKGDIRKSGYPALS